VRNGHKQESIEIIIDIVTVRTVRVELAPPQAPSSAVKVTLSGCSPRRSRRSSTASPPCVEVELVVEGAGI
jgi:hypothetical protein